MSTALIPFEFQGLRSTETVWVRDFKEKVRQFRLTSRGAAELFGAKKPKDYFAVLKHRRPYLPEGVAFTVKATDGKNYLTKTFDLFEIHAYAVESDLPGAKDFLRKFPEFLLALQSGALRHMRPQPEKPICLLTGLPEHTSQRRRAIQALACEKGLSESSIYSHAAKVERGEPIYKGRHRHKVWMERNQTKLQEVYRLRHNERLTLTEIARRMGVSRQTVHRWMHFNKEVTHAYA